MSRIADSIVAAAKTASTFPTGSKLEPPKKTMVIGAERLGPASSVPDVTVSIGHIEALVVEAAPDDPNREQADVWTDVPEWMIGRRL